MKLFYKQSLLGALAFLFVCLSLISAPVQAQTPTPPQTFRVIVSLNSSFRPEGELASANAVTWQRFNIANRQNLLLDTLRRMNIPLNAIKRFQTIPAMALEVDAAGLLALRLDPSVAEIREDRLSVISTNSANTIVNAPIAWSMGATGNGYSVAILDTGVDFTHPALSSKRLAEACFSTTYAPQSAITACPNGTDTQIGLGAAMPKLPPACNDGCDHGTHVAGIAAGDTVVGSPTSYTSGVAPDAMLIGVNVFSLFTDTGFCGGVNFTPCTASYDSDQISGLEYVLSLPASYNVASVNMSLGGGSYSGTCDWDASQAYLNVVSNLKSNRIAVVAASGNESMVGMMGAPACLSNVIAVGATNDSNVVASFSNVSTKLALFAPGVSITSSVPVNWSAVDTNYGTWGGTSMATPYVAGAWAIMRQVYPNDSVDSILLRLQSNGFSVTDNIRSNGSIGTGITRSRINIANSIPTPADVSFTTGMSNPSEGTVINVGVNLSVGAGFANVPSPIVINLTYSGTAQRSLDYTAPSSVILTRSGGWSPNTNYTAVATIPVTILSDDFARTDEAETIIISFVPPIMSGTIGIDMPSAHTATITSTNVQVTGAVNFGASTYTAAEFGNISITNTIQVPVTLTVNGTTSNIVSSPPVTANLVYGGSAVQGTDYSVTQNSITFSGSTFYQGTYTALVPVNIFGRPGSQGNRTFTITLQEPAHPDVVLGVTTPVTTVTIRETTNIVMNENELRDAIMTQLQPTHQIDSVIPDFIAGTGMNMAVILDDSTVVTASLTLASQNGTNRVVLNSMTIDGQPATQSYMDIVNAELPDLIINGINNFVTQRTGATRRIQIALIGASEITFGYLP